MLKRIKITNLLSFGDPGLDLELRPLNVLIGPNGSGKSNLLSVIQVLRALRTDVFAAMRETALITDWIWRGTDGSVATVDVSFAGGLNHFLRFGLEKFDQRILKEHIADNDGAAFVSVAHGQIEFNLDPKKSGVPIYGMHLLGPTDSLLTNYAVAGSRTQELAFNYKSTTTYLSWQFGQKSSLRTPQPADGRSDVLSEDFSNLALVLSRIFQSARAKERIVDEMRKVFAGIRDISVGVEGNFVQVRLHETSFDQGIPANRLSDGTLRYLTLLAILFDPVPQFRTVCIEEPELGLHPDLLPGLAKLMIEASERMQLIVTTHSDIIIDALSETPESVVVCERHEGQTTMRRLVESELSDWLKDYRLGQLWSKGTIGGNRW